MLPFTRDQFLAIFVGYNESIWPAQAAAYLLGLSGLALLLRPGPVTDQDPSHLWLGPCFSRQFPLKITGRGVSRRGGWRDAQPGFLTVKRGLPDTATCPDTRRSKLQQIYIEEKETSMPVSFKYAMIEINKKPVLVDQQTIAEATKSLRDGLAKIEALTDDVLKKGFVFQTPEGMSPVNLGSPEELSDWVSGQMNSSFKLKDSIDGLPEPFKTGLKGLAETDLVIYSAALFYTGGAAVGGSKLYGELVIGFQVPDTFMADFPLRLREIVLAVNNYPPPKTQSGSLAAANAGKNSPAAAAGGKKKP